MTFRMKFLIPISMVCLSSCATVGPDSGLSLLNNRIFRFTLLLACSGGGVHRLFEFDDPSLASKLGWSTIRSVLI